MKHLYYIPTTGQILAIAPNLDDTLGTTYLEISDELAQEFFNGSKITHLYRVTEDKELKSLVQTQADAVWEHVDRRIHAIPTDMMPADFTLMQDLQNKTITVKLSSAANADWIDNDFFGLGYCYIVAVIPNDPHSVLWSKFIPCQELDSYTWKYQGTDHLQFYTKQLFKSYNHEHT